MQPDYNLAQINYVHELHRQAIEKKDIAENIAVSAFMIGCYFHLGYDERFRQYWHGNKHKPTWQGLGKRVDISDKTEMPKKHFGWGQ